ncbi:MAG TPA: PAS domain S-box protein [Gemmataceae bacterium]|nr:PAS domain S-box protein [Gemmataceae bacterium]
MPADPDLRVLVVDDDADTRSNLCDILELDNFQVETAGTVAEVLKRKSWDRISAVLLDRRLPDGSAEELLPRLRQLAPEAAILIVTGYADLQGAIAALRQGAADYILKPINPDALRASLARLAERRRLTLAKERSETAFRTLVEAAPCLIAILRADHRIAYFSPFAEELTGYRADDVLGKDYVTRFLCGECQQTVREQLQRVLSGSPVRGFENPVRGRDGSQRWIIWNAQLLPDYEGEPGILMVGQDITALKHAQERTLQAERLAAIGQMVAGLAHESGNALARSQACLEMLAMEVEDRPEALNLVERIQKAQNHLQQLYGEVRNYAAPLKLEREAKSVRSAWRQAWANLADHRKGREAALREETDEVDLVCPIDSFRLEQVFRNILENALAACKDPLEIRVTCSAALLDSRPALRIAVRDNGPGLSSEQRRRIFEPFFTTKTKGTGLGMAIALRIIEAHGGQIAAAAPAGPGAEIVILLPRGSS